MRMRRLLYSIPVLILGLVAHIHSAPEGRATEPALPSASETIRINEVMFAPSPGKPEWVELKNSSEAPFDLAGYGLTDEDDNWYEFPDSLPPAPPGALIVVIFDGLGPAYDDVNFDDNLATLHAPDGLTEILEDEADQVALYPSAPPQFTSGKILYLPLIAHSGSERSAPVIVAFTAWGVPPGSDGVRAVRAGIWVEGMYRELLLPGEPPEPALEPGESLGLLPDSISAYAHDFAIYGADQVTLGAENPIPTVELHTYAGNTLDGETFALSWQPVPQATSYHFQMDSSDDFTVPQVDLILGNPAYVPATAVENGSYFWRVKPILPAGTGSWSGAKEIHVYNPVQQNTAAPDTPEVLLDIGWQLQRKDTNMLCLAGDHETGGYPTDPSAPWDAPHPHGEGERRQHGLNYCSRAAISMLASYYGAWLSQDRIAYADYAGTGNDLGHGVINNTGMTQLLAWAGIDAERYTGAPSWSQLVEWLDAGRPLIILGDNHFRVIDGYRVTGAEEVHVLDSWTRDQWLPYANQTIILHWVGPATDDDVRSDEDEDGDGIWDTLDDSDGDGIVDFDERHRFDDLDWTIADSDGDEIPDKLDMRGYLFENDGDFRYPQLPPDYDGDGRRKEADADNDNGGSQDGCEDTNHNGRHEPTLGESSNFDRSEEMSCGPGLIAYIGLDGNLWLMASDGSEKIRVTSGGGYRLPRWSHDGTRVGVVRHVSGLPSLLEEIWAYSVADLSGAVVATFAEDYPEWHLFSTAIVNFEWVDSDNRILYAIVNYRGPTREYYLTDIATQSTQWVGRPEINYFRQYQEEKWVATYWNWIEPVRPYPHEIVTATYEEGLAGFPQYTQVPTSCSGDQLHPSWSPDGQTIAYTCDGATLRVYDVTSGAEAVLVSRTPPDDFETPALLQTDWSRDGRQILFSIQPRWEVTASPHDEDGSIYVINADGSNMVWLADGFWPVWQP